MDFIKELEKEIIEANNLPDFKSGDTVIVSYKIKEGAKERIQQFQGVVHRRAADSVTAVFHVDI